MAQIGRQKLTKHTFSVGANMRVADAICASAVLGNVAQSPRNRPSSFGASLITPGVIGFATAIRRPGYSRALELAKDSLIRLAGEIQAECGEELSELTPAILHHALYSPQEAISSIKDNPDAFVEGMLKSIGQSGAMSAAGSQMFDEHFVDIRQKRDAEGTYDSYQSAFGDETGHKMEAASQATHFLWQIGSVIETFYTVGQGTWLAESAHEMINLEV